MSSNFPPKGRNSHFSKGGGVLKPGSSEIFTMVNQVLYIGCRMVPRKKSYFFGEQATKRGEGVRGYPLRKKM